MKKLLLLLAALLLLASCNQDAGDPSPTHDQAYLGTWSVTQNTMTSTFVFATDSYTSTNTLSGITSGTLAIIDATNVKLTTTIVQDAPVSSMPADALVPLQLLGVVLEDQPTTLEVSGDTLTMTMNNSVTTYTKQ